MKSHTYLSMMPELRAKEACTLMRSALIDWYVDHPDEKDAIVVPEILRRLQMRTCPRSGSHLKSGCTQTPFWRVHPPARPLIAPRAKRRTALAGLSRVRRFEITGIEAGHQTAGGCGAWA